MAELQEWRALVALTAGQGLTVERVRLTNGVSIEGRFALPDLARLSEDDQIFVTAFVRAHGSIKEMEAVFGVSYPTVKARLNRIASSLSFIETVEVPSRSEILDRLARGDITAAQAITELEAAK